MLRESGLIVAPEHLAALVPCVAVKARLGVVGAVVGAFHLIDGIVIDGLGEFGSIDLRSGQDAERKTHENTVEPHLIGIDGLVPVDTLVSAGLVVELTHEGIHSLDVSLLGEILIHAVDKMSRAHIVEIVGIQLVMLDCSVRCNHSVGVEKTIIPYVVTAVAQIGVKH